MRTTRTPPASTHRGLHRRRPASRPRRFGRHRRLWQVVAAVVVALLIPVSWSYVSAVTAPGSAGVGVQSVEWLRGHGFAWAVTSVESWWYSHHQPPKGGRPAAGLIPKPKATTAAAVASVPHLPPPPPMVPLASPPIAGEGDWNPIGRTVDGVPSAYAAFVRPDSVHTSLVAGVAWMDTKMLRATLYSGYDEPGGTWQNMAPISPTAATSLVAAFNSGFRLDSSEGGYYTEGRTADPLVDGAASLVIFTDGTATVGQWGRDVTMGPGVASVRQNLSLIVDNGAPVPGLDSDSTSKWGATLGNALYVWRSGVGVTADGALVYAAGPGLSAHTLANVLAHAGAVRAMELDINTEWVDYFHFDLPVGAAASSANATKLLSAMSWDGSRYFTPSSRDFVTMSLRPDLASTASAGQSARSPAQGATAEPRR